MPIVLTNAILVDLDPIRVEPGELRIDGSKIVARSTGPGKVKRESFDEVIDCNGCVVLPGLVNGHTHLYSALAVGMPFPPRAPKNFFEILELVWWRLDQALDDESNHTSAVIGALDAIHCGTTTLIDHHASPRAIDGSLDQIEKGISDVGLRGVLCYEVTDRHGKTGAEKGLLENRRYHGKLMRQPTHQFAALAGAHASFTMSDDSLAGVVQIAKEFGTGVHIHVAEDACDDRMTQTNYKISLEERLIRFDLLRPENIFGHCIHLSDGSIHDVNSIRVSVAHNTRSNMNNAVGYAPIGKLTTNVQLGTDGIGADMFAESKTAWFKYRDSQFDDARRVGFNPPIPASTDKTGGVNPTLQERNITPADVIQMLANSARRASKALGVTLGQLQIGAEADIVVTDYQPFSPITTENLPGHFLFAMTSRDVRDVLIAGTWRLRDRKLCALDEKEIRQKSVDTTKKLWERLEKI